MRRSALAALFLVVTVNAGPAKSLKLWNSPKRGTFRFQQVELSTVLGKLEEHFEQRVKLQADGRSLVDLDAKRLTFFQALDLLATRNKLLLHVDGTSLILMEGAQELPESHVAYFGPSRLSLEEAIRAKDWDESDYLKVELKWLAPEEMVCALVDLKLERIVDDKGTVYRMIETKRYNGFPLNPNSTLTLHLTPPPESATRIIRFAGVLRVAFEAKREKITFKASERTKTKRLGRSAITFHGVPGRKLHFTVSQWSCPEFRGGEHDQPWIRFMTRGKSNRSPQTPNVEDITVHCYGKGKKEIGQAGSISYSHDLGEPRWEHKIGVEKEPATIVFGAVTKLKLRDARFSFSNVTLR